MQTTIVDVWPVPCWPAAHIKRISGFDVTDASRVPADLFDRIRLLALAGALPEARSQLDNFMDTLGSRVLGSGELRQIIPVALLVHHKIIAVKLLASVFATTHPITFVVDIQGSASVVHMKVQGGKATFILSTATFADDQGEILLQRLVDIYPILGSYLESGLALDATLAVNLGDEGHIPGLTFCDFRPGFFPIPDSIFMDFRGYEKVREHYRILAIPWEARLPVAFWRGATTGQATSPAIGWRSLPRVRLSEISVHHPDLIDAGITNVAQIDDPEAETWMIKSGLMRNRVPPEFFQQYKYQIDIDGNSTSWPGLLMKLMTGSAVLKVPPRNGLEQWYYASLKPWTNFVPLASDMSDLVDKVSWLQSNDDVARRIGEAGLQLANDLSLERQLERAVPIVAAASRDAVGAPIVDLEFSVSGSGIESLREGWLTPDQDGVDTIGFQSVIDLARPHGIGGFILRLDVSAAGQESQPVSIVLNGELVARRTINERTSLHVPLARKTLDEGDPIVLTLLHPASAASATAATPDALRLRRLRLHRISILGIGRLRGELDADFAEALAALRSIDKQYHPHDLRGPPFAPSALLKPIYTHHGTIAYADLMEGRVRHRQLHSAISNLFLSDIGDDTVLVRVNQAGQRHIVRFRPEGPFAEKATQSALDDDGYVQRFKRIPQGMPANEFGLAAAGLLLCAEPSGSLILGRIDVGGWELFRTSPLII
nr:glycosyl transferase family 90 [uncultured Rhodopila sp.]